MLYGRMEIIDFFIAVINNGFSQRLLSNDGALSLELQTVGYYHNTPH